MAPTKVFTSSCVYFPNEGPSPGTIVVDLSTGKIVKVERVKAHKGDSSYAVDAEWVDVGDKAIIPGLVEYVYTRPDDWSTSISHFGLVLTPM
jgi:cytosine/adenosine deaminase-related metal-dependent hydrolase